MAKKRPRLQTYVGTPNESKFVTLSNTAKRLRRVATTSLSGPSNQEQSTANVDQPSVSVDVPPMGLDNADSLAGLFGNNQSMKKDPKRYQNSVSSAFYSIVHF
jgi:hypothetical protein